MKKPQETHSLAPIKTELANGRRPRSPNTEETDTGNRILLRAQKPAKDHKASFRSIFRSKPEKDTHPVSPILESPILPPASFKVSTHSALSSSSLPESCRGKTTPSLLAAKTTLRGKNSSTKLGKERKAAVKSIYGGVSIYACDPLPLFRVYSQSIKHAKLASSTLSADSIIRISNQKKDNGIIEEMAKSTLEEGISDGSKAKDKKAGKKKRHKRHLSESISSAAWTESIYILVMSGTLLQYAGEGPVDRTPEKMLQLCKDSVVFASDAISGKHWVLQVSQVIDSDGTLATDSRSLLSRLYRGAEDKRKTNSLLLILENAEDMESWMSVIRRTIESLGGKKHVSETGTPDEDELIKGNSQPSPRAIPGSPYRFSTALSVASESCSSIPQQLKDGLADAAALTSRPLSTVRPSIDSPSISTTTSREEIFLDNLRDNSHHRLSHMSYMSSSPPTIGTSRGSSPSSSPTRDKFMSIDGYSTEHLRPNAMAISERRRSLQTMENPVLQTPTKALRPHSTMVRSAQTFNNFSFDMQNSSNKRSSMSSNFSRSSRSTRSHCDDASEQRLIGLGSRKKSLTALLLSRPLTPVEDSYSPSTIIPYPYATRLDSLPAVRLQRSESPLDPERPQTPSAVTPEMPKPVYSSKRFSSQAALVSYSSREFEPFPRLPPSRPPLPPPQNLPLRPPTPVRSLGPTITSQALSPSRVSKQYLRRPTSMQIRTVAPPVSLLTYPIPRSPISPELAIPPASPTRRMAPLASSSFMTRASNEPFGGFRPTPKQVNNRRSMPQLVSGPPSNPPPVCALPPLPSGVQI